jgi:hypothetical protein
VQSAMLEYFFVKARSETPIICYGSRMTQQESQLIGKVVQLCRVLNYYNSRVHVMSGLDLHMISGLGIVMVWDGS